jgi:hypothetical protein
VKDRISKLEALLRPDNLVQKVRSLVLLDDLLCVGLDSTFDGTHNLEKNMSQMESLARELGKTVALDDVALAELLPELVTSNSQQLWIFGGGLADGTKKPYEIWSQLISKLAAAAVEKGNPQVLRGFLNGLNASNSELANTLLDDAVENETLAAWFPVLQTAAGVDDKGVSRLMHSLDFGKVAVGMYGYLVMGGVMHKVCGSDFNKLLRRIAAVPEGVDVAIQILFMRFYSEEGRRQSSTSQIIEIGCELIRRFRFTNRRDIGFDYKLRTIAANCLVGEEGASTVREVCENLKNAIASSETSAYFQQELLQVLLGAQPFATLEAICGETAEDLKIGLGILEEVGQVRRNAFDPISETDLLKWCDQQPEIRYPAVAGGVTLFQSSGENGRPRWTSIALKLLDNAPDRVEMVRRFVRQFTPMSWWGSRTSIMETNSTLLDDLGEYRDPAVREFVAQEKIRLAEKINTEKRNEYMMQRNQDERFE